MFIISAKGIVLHTVRPRLTQLRLAQRKFIVVSRNSTTNTQIQQYKNNMHFVFVFFKSTLLVKKLTLKPP